MARPQPGEYGSFYQRYIDYTTGDTIAAMLANHLPALNRFYNSIPAAKADYAYAPGKWTIKQLMQHLIDTERIFSYRLTRISRNDDTPMAGFDEDTYASNATAAHRTLPDLIKEFALLRESTALFLNSLTEEQLSRTGTASGWLTSANAICYIIIGHNLHHKKILEERYGL